MLNHKKGTYYSDLRAKNGNPELYNVKIMDIGNEVVKEIKTEKNKVTYSFPAHSFTQIKIELKK